MQQNANDIVFCRLVPKFRPHHGMILKASCTGNNAYQAGLMNTVLYHKSYKLVLWFLCVKTCYISAYWSPTLWICIHVISDVCIESPDLPSKPKKTRGLENITTLQTKPVSSPIRRLQATPPPSPVSNKTSLKLTAAPSPAKVLTPKRQPLTPRRENILSSPNRTALTSIRTPGKENAITSNSTMPSGTARMLDFSPRVSDHCPTPIQKQIPITKGRSLNFDSPVKTARASPRKSIGTPRPNVRPVMSPLRLARQDGMLLFFITILL